MKKIPIRNLGTNVNDVGTSQSFKIRRVSDVLNGKNLAQDLHRHNFFFILALEKGKGLHEIDFVPYQVFDSSVFLMRPGQVHQLNLEADCSGYLMEFDPEFYHPSANQANQRLRKVSNKNFCRLSQERFEKLNGILTSIYDEFSEKLEGFHDAIKANLEIFFIELVRQSQNPKGIDGNITSYAQEKLEEYLELLDNNITEQKQVSWYTGALNLSPYQLNEITKSTVGKTASELINDRIILEARRYLLATPNQVKDIAFHLGYEDVSYFIRFFKKHTGLSPELFRQNSQ